jgi:hypothetical protein
MFKLRLKPADVLSFASKRLLPDVGYDDGDGI